MKSKTSCFNAMIFKKNISHYWPVWVLFLCYVFFILPVNIWADASNAYYFENVSVLVRNKQIIGEAVRIAVTPAPIFLFAAVMALAVFSYLYTAKNANAIHALPVNRLELFVTNYVSGLLFLLVPELLAFVAAVMVCLANQITCIEYLFWWLLCVAGVSFFAYSFAVFVAMFTGLAFAMPFYFVIANYLYVGCMYLVFAVKNLLCYGLADSAWNPGKSCILSPLYYLTNNLRARVVYDDNGMAAGISVSGWELVAGYAVAAVVLTAAAYWLYKRRQIENAGDFVSIRVVKPVFRWGVALCGGTALTLFAMGIIQEARGVVNTFPYVLICMLLFCGICFWLAEMLLQKNFRVFRKKKLLEWAGVLAVSVCFVLMFQLDLFRIEKRVPELSEVKAAFVNMDFPIELNEEELSELLELHREIIQNKKEYRKNEQSKDGKYYYTTLRYYLKDGEVLERRYALPVTQDYLADENSPTAKFLAWEKQPERIKQQMLGLAYESNTYYTGYIDLFSEDGENITYYFEREELEQLVAAIEKDAEEGNFNAYQLTSEQQESETYANGIGLNYYNPDNIYSIWDYYNNYGKYQDGNQQAFSNGMFVTVADTSNYICFGADCVNVVKTLEDLGIINEKWHLYTYQEWENVSLKQ